MTTLASGASTLGRRAFALFLAEGPGPLKSRQLQAAQLPERSRPVPLSALGLSVVALLFAALANQLWPQAVAGASAVVWLLALIPLLVLTYYKGWGIAAVVLAMAMTLIVAIEVAMAGGLRGESLDWRALAFSEDGARRLGRWRQGLL